MSTYNNGYNGGAHMAGGVSGMGNQFNGGAAGQQFMNNIPNVSPEMLNLGLSAGQDMINKQREKWMPEMSSLWIDMKSYFAVSYDFYEFSQSKVSHLILDAKLLCDLFCRSIKRM